MRQVIRDPGAWLPILFALLALADVLVFGVIFGPVRQPDGDEGTPAHLFQGLMFLVALAIGVFAVRWLPRAPREAAMILGLQIAVAALPLATLAMLESRAAA